MVFDLRGEKRAEISFEGLRLPNQDELVSWDDVGNFEYENGIGADVLTITLKEKGLLGSKSKKVKLPGISKQREAFKEVLGRYWHRHQVMRQSIPA